MKASVAKIYQNLVKEVSKALAYLANDKTKRAEKKLESIVSKVEKKLSKAKASTPKKRKPSAFALYYKNNREAAKAANPKMKAADIMKMLGEQYRAEKSGKSPKAASPKAASPKAASPKKTPAKRTRKPKA